MHDLWDSELTEKEEEALLYKAAKEIRRRKLETPAILALESHKPLANVLAQSAIVFSGFLIPFLGFQNVNDYSRLLRKRENIERLIRLLEEKEAPEGQSEAGSSPSAEN